MKCLTPKEASMHMYGFGFPGQGFHCLKIPGGLVRVEKGGMTETKMEEELKHLIDGK